MGKASKDKGARGERLFRDLCHKYGFEDVQRGGQLPYQKGSQLADVEGLAGCHLEIKFQEKLNTRAAIEQCVRDCQEGEMPILAHKTARKDWLITMKAEDWFSLYRAWLDKQPPDAILESKVRAYFRLFAKKLMCWQRAGFPQATQTNP